MQSLCGWTPRPDLTRAFVATAQVRTLSQAAPHLLPPRDQVDTYLWLPLLQCKPAWHRGNQAIGDCVSWGAELCATMLMAVQHALGISTWVEEAATEPIYGGRAELGQGSWSDGWWGSGAAQWLRDYGVILRQDYSQSTGNPETDLRAYSGTRAKNWGYYGCGGRPDGISGRFDQVAKEHPVRITTAVPTVDELEAAIRNGYPVSVASGVGYGSIVRDSDGVVRRSGSWSHQMMFGGIRYHPKRGRLFRQFNSWGACASGPDPGIDSEAISESSWWTTEEDAQRQLDAEDSFAFGDAAGWPARKLPDWGSESYL
jgi:hypothetical protein